MHLIEAISARPPGDVVLVDAGRNVTAGELLVEAGSLASAIRAATDDSRLIAIACSSPRAVLASMAGVQAAGGVPMSVNVRLPEAVLAEIAARTEPIAWVGDRSPPGAPTLEPTSPDGEPAHPAEISVVVLTSGTTAIPRARAFDAAALDAVHQAEAADDPDGPGVMLGAMPMGNLFMATRLPSVIARGGSVVLLDRWDASSALASIREHGVDTVPGVPTQFIDLLAEPDRGERLRRCIIGGAPTPTGMVRALRERFGCEVVLRYSTTEAGAIASSGPVDADGAPLRPLTGVELTIEDGRVMVRSPMASRGAWNGAPSPAWIDTGDLGTLTPDGLRLRGRADDAFTRGGTTIVPTEIEAILGGAPGVSEAIVVGEEDARFGMRAVAYVVGTADTDDVLRHAREHLASYLVPDEIRSIEAIPRTPTGKPDRRALLDL